MEHSLKFSDTTILYPGQRISPELFHEKPGNLGYGEGAHMPERKGELRRVGSTVEVFLHALEAPSVKHAGFPVRMRLSHNQIDAITRLDNGMSLPILELEPEKITPFFGPERWQLAIAGRCPEPKEEVFLVDTAPVDPCQLHEPLGAFERIIEGVKNLFKNR
ncbi:MAG: hypothetical protein JRF50_07135 [Deltaproteobacteria bacterium]|nr:hypothetical protein [Deltaproteobacteria bacterium]